MFLAWLDTSISAFLSSLNSLNVVVNEFIVISMLWIVTLVWVSFLQTTFLLSWRLVTYDDIKKASFLHVTTLLHTIFPLLIDAYASFISFGGFIDGGIDLASPLLLVVRIFVHFIATKSEFLSTFSFFQILCDVGSCISHSLLQF
jgi:hypothetical protein